VIVIHSALFRVTAVTAFHTCLSLSQISVINQHPRVSVTQSDYQILLILSKWLWTTVAMAAYCTLLVSWILSVFAFES